MAHTPQKRRYGDKDWTHKSVHALMSDRGDHEDPSSVIRGAVRDLADGARQYGWAGPPFDPFVLAELQGIRVSAGPPGMPNDALIRPLSSGDLEIVWSPAAPLARRNFSVFHEIGHTLFPDCFELVRHRRDRDRFDPDRELEGLCDMAASELLMPDPEFPGDLAKRGGLAAAAVEALAARYAASREAVARRAVALQRAPCLAVFLSERHKPADGVKVEQGAFDFYEAPAKKLRIDYTVSSGAARSVIAPRHKSVPDNSCTYTALREGRAASGGVETWTVGGGRELSGRVDALPLSTTPEGDARVLALVALP